MPSFSSKDTSTADASSSLQLVPETLLKRRHNLDELKAKRAANQVKKGNRKVFSASSKRLYVKKAETFLAQAQTRKNHDVRFKRVQKKGMQKRASDRKVICTKTLVDDNDNETEQTTTTTTTTYQSNSVGASMVFCIRIHDNVAMTGRIRRVLYKLRLKNQHEGVFIEYNAENRKLLHLVEPWVLYGTPTSAMVDDLIRRRGHGRVKGKRVPLSDNVVIEEALGASTGIICVEDLVEELCNNRNNEGAGSHFATATEFLWPFQLRAPKSRFQTQKLNDKDGKEYGDKGQEIDEYIKVML